MSDNIGTFGHLPDGSQVRQVTLRSGPASCRIITYGGAVQSLQVPGRTGEQVDVVLGFDTLEDYQNQDKFLGALVGRYANRIGGSRFTLNGREYPLYANEGENHLHGGKVGFDKQLWTIQNCTENTLTLALESPDGQEGYPGSLSVQVTYALEGSALSIRYLAKSDRDTLCNLTNHAYFNLSGHGSGSIAEHRVQLFASQYTPTDRASIPTGELADVEGTPMDLRRPVRLGDRLDDSFAQLVQAGGYDHNWVVDREGEGLCLAARVYAPDTGITLETETTLPGIQFYSGNYLDGCPAGKGGAPYARRGGLCLETQFFPDSPNRPGFPSAVLRAGEEYRHTTVYRFSAD